MYGITKNEKMVFWLAGLVSIILSLWMSLREAVINPDAICYLLSAAEVKNGVHAAMHICSQAQWPFYSVLVYGFAFVTHLSFTASAYFLDGFFSLVSVISFIAIVRYIAQRPRVVWLAALVILLAHEFNSVRQYIVRDHGYWAFYLLSLFFLLHYFKNYQWRYSLLWSCSLIIATLFRVEGAIFLLLIPIAALFDHKRNAMLRLKSFLQLNSLTILIGIILSACVAISSHIELARLHELSGQVLNGVSDIGARFANIRQLMITYIIPDSARDAGLVLFLMLVSWYIISVITNLSLIYSILVVYAWCKRIFAANFAIRLALWSYITVNFLITVAFLAEHLFLSKRYLVALSLVLMLWVPVALDYLWQNKLKKWFIAAIVFIFISSLGGIFDFGYSKKYIHDAGNWLSENVPQTATMYSNDYQLMYYSQHFGNQIFEKAQAYIDKKFTLSNQYDFIALRVNQRESDSYPKSIIDKYILAATFANKRGDQVRIYRRNPQ